MKTYTLSLFIICIVLVSCSDLEESPLGRVNAPEMAYQDLSNLNATSIAMYAALRGEGSWAEGFGCTQYMTTMYGADDLTTYEANNKEPFREFDKFNKTESNIWMPNLYRGCYRAIINANAITENFKYTQANKSEIDNLVGQAYFIRALSYFYLVRSWGEIPLFTTISADPEIQKSPIADVYDLLIGDLKQAEILLPDDQADVGRPKKGAAKALLAKVYLTKAGWPLKDQASYALAAEKAKEVIDNKAKWGYGLLPDCNSIWLRAFDNSEESVFALQYDKNVGDGTHANHILGKASIADYEEGGWDDFFCELTFFNEFPEGLRKDATFRTKFITKNHDTIDYKDSRTRHPYYAKFRDGAVNDATPWISEYHTAAAYALMRYAEVLLIYAEAQAQAYGADASAYDAINQVRKRAGLDDLPQGMSAQDFANAVIDERGWELAGEGQRWYDLLRTEQVATVVNKRDTNEQVKIIGAITEDNFYSPFPEFEILKNPNLAK
ncbi:MAG: RagB/SusD family nutrient uptake outer membrane protein [Salinivirgaceae bacterium]